MSKEYTRDRPLALRGLKNKNIFHTWKDVSKNQQKNYVKPMLMLPLEFFWVPPTAVQLKKDDSSAHFCTDTAYAYNNFNKIVIVPQIIARRTLYSSP